jgi:quinolinate synthase
MLQWALDRGDRVLFLPDQNLARNTARRLGLSSDEIFLWDPHQPISPEALRSARLLAWSGVCNVHRRFAPWQVDQARAAYPGAEILVHPEVAPEVAQAADRAGSTTQIIQWVEEAAPGSTLVVGTEHRLIQQLANAHPDKTILGLSEVPTFCCTMTQVRATDLLHTLESLAKGDVPSPVVVPQQWIDPARLAVERMLTASD